MSHQKSVAIEVVNLSPLKSCTFLRKIRSIVPLRGTCLENKQLRRWKEKKAQHYTGFKPTTS